MSVQNDPNQVVRYGRQLFEQDEAETNSAVPVGSLVQAVGGSGEYGDDPTIDLVDTDGAELSSVRIALDDRSRGMRQGDSYEAGEVAKYAVTAPGSGFFVRLAAGESVTLGESLVPTTDGEVRAFDGSAGDSAETVVAEAAEDLDNSGGSSAVYVGADR
jgi:hypothetical protein